MCVRVCVLRIYIYTHICTEEHKTLGSETQVVYYSTAKIARVASCISSPTPVFHREMRMRVRYCLYIHGFSSQETNPKFRRLWPFIRVANDLPVLSSGKLLFLSLEHKQVSLGKRNKTLLLLSVFGEGDVLYLRFAIQSSLNKSLSLTFAQKAWAV